MSLMVTTFAMPTALLVNAAAPVQLTLSPGIRPVSVQPVTVAVVVPLYGRLATVSEGATLRAVMAALVERSTADSV